MGSIRVHEFISLDGVIDAPSWTFPFGFDQRMGEALGRVTGNADGILAIGGGSAIDTAKHASAQSGKPAVHVPTTYSGAEWTTFYGIRYNGANMPKCTDAMIEANKTLYDKACPKGSMIGSGPVTALLGPSSDPSTALPALWRHWPEMQNWPVSSNTELVVHAPLSSAAVAVIGLNVEPVGPAP